jgi:hypothetical protein
MSGRDGGGSHIVVRDQRRFGWFSVDNEIIDNHGPQIGAYGVAVYCVISRHSRNQVAKLSQRDIAAGLGISHDRVGKSLSALSELGLIAMDVPERPGPGLITTITLLDVKVSGRLTSSCEAELDATRPHNKEEKTKTETTAKHPPTPLFDGGISDIGQKFYSYLKDDLSTAYVNNGHFQECAFDKYFRDSYLVEIKNGVAFLDSPDPTILRAGVEKFQSRLRRTFQGVVEGIHAVWMCESQRVNLEASA